MHSPNTNRPKLTEEMFQEIRANLKPLRDELTEIEAVVAEKLDRWYLKAKDSVENCGPHFLGRHKEAIKTDIEHQFDSIFYYLCHLEGRKVLGGLDGE